MSDIERIARVAAEECSRVWRSEWVRVIAEKDAEIANLKALAAGVTHHAECWRQSQESAKADAEIQRLREAIIKFWADQCGNRACGCDEWPECTHTMAAFELHAVAHPPQQMSSACGHQRHAECRFAACVCECHNPPQQKDGE